MLLRRKGLWLAYALACMIYTVMPSVSRLAAKPVSGPPEEVWRIAGQMVFQFNMFLTLAAGLLAAESLDRDRRTGVDELRRSAPIGRWPYLLGKYFGALAATLTPYLLWVALFGAALVALRAVPVAFLPGLLAAFAAIAIPAHVFAAAFALGGGLILPLRVFQVLFTGYWFWGNYLSSAYCPTLAGTLLTPGGTFAFEGLFGGFRLGAARHTPAEAWLNLAVLGLCAAAALALTERHLARRP
jgi:ABC-2 type transport system permease protein